MLHIQMSQTNEAQELFKKVLDISPYDEHAEIFYNIANSYYFLQKYQETIEWCNKIINTYPEEQKEALYLMASSYFYLYNIESSLKCLSKIWKISNNCFEEEFLNDKRFKPMFSNMEILLNNNNKDNDN